MLMAINFGIKTVNAIALMDLLLKVLTVLKEWYQNDKLHRVDGPAVEYINGDKSWYQNGKRHRTDGPAVEGIDGTKSWWLNGKMVKWFQKRCSITIVY